MTDVPIVESEVETRQELAPQWKVLLLNDDVTTVEFVVWLLVSLFHKARPEAVRLTWEVHETGSALVTVTS